MHSSECAACGIKVADPADFSLLNPDVDFQLWLLLPGLRTSEFSSSNLNVGSESAKNEEEMKTNDFCEDCLVSVTRIADIYAQVRTLLHELEQLKSKVKTTIQGSHLTSDDIHNIQSGCNEEHRDAGPNRAVRIRRAIGDALGLLDAVGVGLNDDGNKESNDAVDTKSSDAVDTKSSDAVDTKSSDAIDTKPNYVVNQKSNDAIVTESNDAIDIESNDAENTESNDANNLDELSYIEHEEILAVVVESQHDGNVKIELSTTGEPGCVLLDLKKQFSLKDCYVRLERLKPDELPPSSLKIRRKKRKYIKKNSSASPAKRLQIKDERAKKPLKPQRKRLHCDIPGCVSYRLTEEELQRHKLREHSKELDPSTLPADNIYRYRCDFPQCKDIAYTSAGLRNHRAVVHNCRVTTCETGEEKDDVESLKTRRLYCDQPNCLKFFITFRTFNEHKRTVHGLEVEDDVPGSAKEEKLLKCDVPGCKKSSFSHARLLAHKKKVHQDISHPFTCEKCGQLFTTGGTYRTHLKAVHGGTKDCICHICGKAFAVQSYLNLHLETHSAPKYKCRFCPRAFKNPTGRTCHERSTHTGERPYVCDRCGKGFVIYCKLKNHVNAIHNKNVRPFVCPLCGKDFPIRRYLQMHYVNSHKGHPVPSTEECRIQLDSDSTHTNNEPATMANDSAYPN